ncbi:MAG TPA: aldehyde dehydrogenase family protein [Actinophytocola sp.]|nr:aldehyde dehydrogenase family protein [Actinophytocola sp.]
MSAYRNHIAGWRDAESGRTFRRTDPADRRREVGEFADSSAADVDRAVTEAVVAQRGWAARSPIDRARVLARAAALLDAAAGDLGAVITAEEGKTRVEAAGEVVRAAEVFDYVAALARLPEGGVFASSRPEVTLRTMRRPLGAVAVITPFNFPVFVPSFKLAAALVAGNSVVWKPSPVTPLTGIRVLELLLEAGLPAGVIGYVTGASAEPGEALVSHPGIAAVSFTGSGAVGGLVERGCAERGIRAQVEMGGNNAAVVLADADLELAAAAVVDGAFSGTGQKCTATRRVYVERGVADKLVELVGARAAALRVGPGTVADTEIGPLATDAAATRVEEAVARRVDAGAQLAVGGHRPTAAALRHGCYFEPTVILERESDPAGLREEVFGPVVGIQEVADETEALELTNATPFGLCASVFTDNLHAAERFARRAVVGVVNINLPTTGIEPQVPFGGLKESGRGPKELGPRALDFFTHEATVAVRARTETTTLR